MATAAGEPSSPAACSPIRPLCALMTASAAMHADCAALRKLTEAGMERSLQQPVILLSASMGLNKTVDRKDQGMTSRKHPVDTPCVEVHSCEFVSATDLVPRNWDAWFWAEISHNAPFSWGDNYHSLVTASDFARHCEARLDDSLKVKRFLRKLRALGETYVDLES